eukprot:SAG22_NODE_1000_length_6090_cov_9.522117_3_plen_115_part_00
MLEPKAPLTIAADHKTGPNYYHVVAWLDALIVGVTAVRSIRPEPTKGAALLSLAMLRFFVRKFDGPEEQEAIIQGSSLGWLATFVCSCVRSPRRLAVATAAALPPVVALRAQLL